MSNTLRALYVIVGLALLSLPAVRNSPDHGVAYDITGNKLADPGSMTNAVRLAVRFANTRAGLRALESGAATLHERTPS